MSEILGMKDSTGAEILYNDVVEFDFSELMDTMFANSGFGKTIAKEAPDKCYFHFKQAQEFAPDYGWIRTCCYVVYFVKDGEFILEDAEPGEKDWYGDLLTHYFHDFTPRFLVYLKAKDKFVVRMNTEARVLTKEHIQLLKAVGTVPN